MKKRVVADRSGGFTDQRTQSLGKELIFGGMFAHYIPDIMFHAGLWRSIGWIRLIDDKRTLFSGRYGLFVFRGILFISLSFLLPVPRIAIVCKKRIKCRLWDSPGAIGNFYPLKPSWTQPEMHGLLVNPEDFGYLAGVQHLDIFIHTQTLPIVPNEYNLHPIDTEQVFCEKLGVTWSVSSPFLTSPYFVVFHRVTLLMTRPGGRYDVCHWRPGENEQNSHHFNVVMYSII